MANRKILTLASLAALSLISIAALVLSPSASGADTAADNRLGPNHVAGEKLDSGLGEMRADWTGRALPVANPREPGGSPTQAGHHVAGEKLDSGLGELPPYHAWNARHRWAPEKIAERASR